MINPNNSINNNIPGINIQTPNINGTGQANKAQFAGAMEKAENYLSKVDDLQQSSETSMKDLMNGSNEDITSVVSAVAKADMSFKLLVGVRNKLVEAYKQTMNMPL